MNPVEIAQAACSAEMSSLQADIANTAFWGNTFLLAGAVVAAVGSAFAGFLKGDSARKVAAVVGALGAVLSVCPKVLQDPAVLHVRLSRADRHRTMGEKVAAQLPLFVDEEGKRECAKYAVARFTDCRAQEPPEMVPELPDPSVSSDGLQQE